MVILGLFYEDIKKDYNKAERYYLMAVEKKDKGAKNNLASLYYHKNYIAKKAISLELTEELQNVLILYFQQYELKYCFGMKK